MTALTHRSFVSITAVAGGYACSLLKGECYPGLVRRDGHSTSGVLYWDVDEATFALLDAFEDEVYVRELLEVTTAGGERVSAMAYIIPSHRADLLSTTAWHVSTFLTTHGKAYLCMCRAAGQHLRDSQDASASPSPS